MQEKMKGVKKIGQILRWLRPPRLEILDVLFQWRKNLPFE
jgi:hypothetical protein